MLVPTVIGVLILLLISAKMSYKTSLRAKVKIQILTLYCMGIILWPLLWKILLKENAYTFASLPSLFWPLTILGIEIYLLKYHTFENEMRSKKGIISMDASTICTLTFALGSVLSAHQNECCQNLFLYGVLGCIAFVMPNPSVPPDTIENVLIETFQKVCLTYSTSLLLAGAFLLHATRKKKEVTQ